MSQTKVNQVKVALFCNADAPELYGDDGVFGKDYKLLVSEGELAFKGFAGYLEQERRAEFVREASTAHVVIMDCWNYQRGMNDDPYDQASSMARSILLANPRATLFVQLMEGRADERSHKVPGVRIFDHWNESQIVDEIVLAHRRITRPLYSDMLLFDDSPVHMRFGGKQLSRTFNVWTASSWDEALRKLQYGGFKYLLSDLLVPASAENQGPCGIPYVGKEAPMGAIMALLALAHGVRGIGVVTDKGHHDHPASAAFDYFPEAPVTIGSVKILLTNQPNLFWVNKETCEQADEKGANTVLAKDWLGVAVKIAD